MLNIIIVITLFQQQPSGYILHIKANTWIHEYMNTRVNKYTNIELNTQIWRLFASNVIPILDAYIRSNIEAQIHEYLMHSDMRSNYLPIFALYCKNKVLSWFHEFKNMKIFYERESIIFCYINCVSFIHDNPSYENIQSSCQETHASIKFGNK